MTPHAPRKLLRCAIYTRKSTEHNLDLEFNSLDAQREACEANAKQGRRESIRRSRGVAHFPPRRSQPLGAPLGVGIIQASPSAPTVPLAP
jgi:hypothetical protein